jgi:RNA polymerase sigma factor (sigma-70 family)
MNAGRLAPDPVEHAPELADTEASLLARAQAGVNEANRALERRSRRPARVAIGVDELQLPAPAALDPSRQAENSELRRALGRALAELPPPLRTALVLRDVEGLSTQEAAEIAGIGQAAFKSRLHQARLRVRAAIGDQALATVGG